jgi:TolB-like protein/Flp pilus assembly protein TadD
MNGSKEIRAYKFGTFRLDISTRQLARGAQIVPLTAKLFDLLSLLVRNRGQILTKERLLSELWPDSFVEENNLTVAISALRKALGESHGEHEYIETVPKHGYRFVALVQELSAAGNAQSELADVEATRRAVWTREDVPITSLAVLPLTNTSNDPELDYLSEGITESLINCFSRLPQLRVMAQSTVFRYKGQQVDPLSVGRSLRVNIVLMGRMAHLAEQIVIGLELVNVEDGSQLWGEQYKLKLSNIFEVQDRIVSEVSTNLWLRLTLAEKKQAHTYQTSNLTAYRYYLKGRHFLGKRMAGEIKKSIEYFHKAIEQDSNYAQAYAGIADCYSLLGSYGVMPEKEALRRARPAAERALKLEPTLTEAYTSLGFINTFYDWDWAGAEQHFQRAIELNPNHVAARHWYALLLMALGRFSEAQRELEYNMLLSPLSPNVNVSLGIFYYYTRHYEMALSWSREALELAPAFFPAYAALGLAYLQLGMCQEAIAAHRSAFKISSDPEPLGILGYTYARAGKLDEARKTLKQLEELALHRYVKPYLFALIYIGLGENNSAFTWLERAFRDRNDLVVVINIDPCFDALRNAPRLVSLLEKMAQPSVAD